MYAVANTDGGKCGGRNSNNGWCGDGRGHVKIQTMAVVSGPPLPMNNERVGTGASGVDGAVMDVAATMVVVSAALCAGR